jgi:thiamine biosynthesis lipoprotein
MRSVSKKILSISLIAVMTITLIISQTGCSSNKEAEPVVKESYYFDTVCRISVYDMEDMSKKNAEAAIDKAFSICARYESLLSKTKKGSDIWNVNHAGGRPVKCSPETIKIVRKGIRYGRLSDGAFDITIGKAEDLWDFHSGKKKVPSEKALANAMKYVDYRQIKISGDTITMGTSKGEIDLGGIAKGYIGDVLYDAMKKSGVRSAIISLGGNIVCIGGKSGKPFKIGIEKPFTDMSEIIGYTKMKDGTAVTSGIYERYFKKNGRIYHHILDPETGMPVNNDISGVTITGEPGHSADCDAMSTICLIYGSDKAIKFMEKMDGYEALTYSRSGEIKETGGMDFTKEK